MSAVKAAHHKRHEARQAYHHALIELEQRKATHNRLNGAPGKEEKAAAAATAVQKAQQAADEAKKEFEAVAKRFLGEFEKFKADKGEEIKRVLVEYVRLKVRGLLAWADGVYDCSS